VVRRAVELIGVLCQRGVFRVVNEHEEMMNEHNN
jgi:hypothetical protein